MAKRRTKSKPKLPTLAEVKDRFGLFLSAVQGHLVARYWTMWSNGKLNPGHKAKSIGQVRRTADPLGPPLSGVVVEKSGSGTRIGSLPSGRGAGRVQLDLERIEAVPKASLAIRDVRVALQRAIRDGGVRERKASEYHAQLCATLTTEHEARLQAAEAESRKQAAENATSDATNETSDAAVGGNA